MEGQKKSRKRKPAPETWEREMKKRLRNSKEIRLTVTEPKVACNHNTNFCKAAELTEEDIKGFFDLIYEEPNAEAQNARLMNFMVPYFPTRETSTKENPRKRTSAQYMVRKVNGDLVVVCAKSFQSITTMELKRLNRLNTYFLSTGKARKERRGGSREYIQQMETTNSINNFLALFEPLAEESHYGRSNSSRLYLSLLLTICSLWQHWKNLYINENPDGLLYSYTQFRNIFNYNFNFGFGTPRTDVCSTCAEFDGRMKAPNIGDEEKEQAEFELKMHRLESKCFNNIQKEHKDECYTYCICFDLQQNLPLSRTNISEVFYKRQLWLYNLGFVCMGASETPYLYSWLESESGRGSNEIVSALFDLLDDVTAQNSFKRKKYRILSLFSDSCSGQNKNFTMMLALLIYVNNDECPFQKIRFTFPVRGHSYMAPDRVFGRIEKEVKRHETILLPSEYHEIFRRQGTVRTYGEWKVKNYKVLSDGCVQKNCPFIRDSKRWLFKKNEPFVWTSSKYSGPLTKQTVLKKKST